MEAISSADFAGRLPEILHRVRTGESFIITEDGAEAARLIPPAQPAQSPALPPGAPMPVAEAVATICNLCPTRPLKRAELRSFIDDGRRFGGL